MNIYDLDIYRLNVEYANQYEVSRVIECKFVQDLTGKEIFCDITDIYENKKRHLCSYDPNTHVVSFVLDYQLTKYATTYTGQFAVTMPDSVIKTSDFKIVVNPSKITNQEEYDANQVQIQAMEKNIQDFQKDTSTDIALFKKTTNQSIKNMDGEITRFGNDISQFETDINQFKETTTANVNQVRNDLTPKIDTNTKALSGLAPINLLVNGDFQCNQRGQSTYPFGSYGIDMWFADANVHYWSENGLIFDKTWQQIPLLKGKNYVFSYQVDQTNVQKNIFIDSLDQYYDDGYLKVKLETNVSLTKVRIEKVDTSNGDRINYVQLVEGNVAYPHFKEDHAIAQQRCFSYIQKIPFTMFGYSNAGIQSMENYSFFTKMESKPSVVLTKKNNTNLSDLRLQTITDSNFRIMGKNASGGTYYLNDGEVIATCEPL